MTLLQLRLVEHFSHKAHYVMHIAYLSLVFVESHGYYGYAAGGLGIVVLAGSFVSAKAHSLEVLQEAVEEII